MRTALGTIAGFAAGVLLVGGSAAAIDCEPPPPPPGAVTVAVVGDVACPPAAATTATACQQQAVGDLIRANAPDKVIVTGDIQYQKGELAWFNQSYDPAFGSFKADTLPVPGNHEYGTPGASGYAAYFGDPAPYWYSKDIGAWHVVFLDSNCGKIGGCGWTKPQGTWLQADLAANTKPCVAGVWHHPRYNAGSHGDAKNMTWAWKILANNGGDIVLNGHDHNYQRWAPINGMTEFVVGTGGKSFYAGALSRAQVGIDRTFGAAFFDLHSGGYSWQFKNLNGQVLDSGSGVCDG